MQTEEEEEEMTDEQLGEFVNERQKKKTSWEFNRMLAQRAKTLLFGRCVTMAQVPK